MDTEEKVEEETLDTPEEGENSQKAPELSAEEIAELKKKASAYESTKIRAEKAEGRVDALLKNKPEQKVPVQNTNTIDQIKLGKKLVDYSDEELDFVVEHAKSKNPEDVLKALENPFIQAGIKAHREKVEKERLALKPTNKQSESDEPISLEDALAGASTLKEKEEILKQMGYSTEYGHRPDQVFIGRQ